MKTLLLKDILHLPQIKLKVQSLRFKVRTLNLKSFENFIKDNLKITKKQAKSFKKEKKITTPSRPAKRGGYQKGLTIRHSLSVIPHSYRIASTGVSWDALLAG
jgi:hypothetical protein